MSQLQKEPETLTISRAAALIGISRGKVRTLIETGHFRSHKIGSRKYLLRDELIEDLKK